MQNVLTFLLCSTVLTVALILGLSRPSAEEIERNRDMSFVDAETVELIPFDDSGDMSYDMTIDLDADVEVETDDLGNPEDQ